MQPKILIVGTVPYNKNSSSRAFDAYFHNFSKENLAQIFSDTKTPCKGHCKTLYQITDYQMLQKWKHQIKETGKIFYYDELPINWKDSNDLEINSEEAKRAYKFGRKHTPLIYLLRGILWKKKYWCTPKLLKWLDNFKPDCVFLSFSDSFFIPQIALFVAKRYNIPIISSIGDDYYFNNQEKNSVSYWIYKKLYKSLIDKVLAWKGSAIYISDKIRDKYNKEFNLDGETVYLTSNIKRKEFSCINSKNPLITYFGNIRMGRNDSLCSIASEISKIDSSYKIEVYSNEKDEEIYKELKEHPNIIYGGSIPYEKVQEKMSKSDITIIVEGTKKKDIELSRYSLSTKAADTLSSGCSILVFGSEECGIIEYMKKTKAAIVCTREDEIEKEVRKLLNNKILQKQLYDQAIEITRLNHNLQSSCKTFEMVVEKSLKKR